MLAFYRTLYWLSPAQGFRCQTAETTTFSPGQRLRGLCLYFDVRCVFEYLCRKANIRSAPCVNKPRTVKHHGQRCWGEHLAVPAWTILLRMTFMMSRRNVYQVGACRFRTFEVTNCCDLHHVRSIGSLQTSIGKCNMSCLMCRAPRATNRTEP